MSVDTILFSTVGETRPVHSRGKEFYNKDSWYARTFISSFCEWARLNRELGAKDPTLEDVEKWVYHSRVTSEVSSYQREIVIAETPDDLPRHLAMALVGGAYHEAWHTLYSRRTPLRPGEVFPRLSGLWTRMTWDPSQGHRGWSRMAPMLLHWSNLIEDIRIERLGCAQFPGAEEKMVALQDLILEQEGPPKDPMGCLMGLFRDLGLGYHSSTQRLRLEMYREVNPKIYALVTEGRIRPLLDRAIALTPGEDMESLWLAMEIAIVINEEALLEKERAKPKPPPSPKPQPPQKPQPPPEQQDASPEDDAEKGEGSPTPPPKKPLIFKVGDRVKIRTGENAGKVGVVVRAELPDPMTGFQDLEISCEA